MQQTPFEYCIQIKDLMATPTEPTAAMHRTEKRSLGECPVCCEKYTKASRKPIACAACDYEACLACSQQYLTTVENAGCMQCGHAFNLEFLQLNFSKTWIDGAYKTHRRNILVESEKALLPTSQHMVQNWHQCERLTHQLREESDERKALLLRVSDLDHNKFHLRARITRYHRSRYNEPLIDDAADTTAPGEGSSTESSARHTSFIMRCPVADCRGFLSNAYKCGTCTNYACSKCLTSTGLHRVDPSHVCNQADVDTVKLLKADTRSCPKCSTGIHKIEGCDQMFCVMCKTSFSWRTGQIVTRGVIHNPHYFEWMRQQSTTGEIPRQPGDDFDEGPCGDRLVSARELGRHLNHLTDELSIAYRQELLNHIRITYHVNGVVMGDALRVPPPEEENLDLRLKYLLGQIGEERWKNCLVMREKRREKVQAFRMAYDVLIRATGDIIRSMDHTDAGVALAFDAIQELVRYARLSVLEVRDRFKCTVPYDIPFSNTTEIQRARDRLSV